jgi:hypothetical protein
VFRQVLDSLSDDFQFPQRRILAHAIVDERIVVTATVRGDVLECVPDVLKIDAVVFHSAAASARILCCRLHINEQIDVTSGSIVTACHRAKHANIPCAMPRGHFEDFPPT